MTSEDRPSHLGAERPNAADGWNMTLHERIQLLVTAFLLILLVAAAAGAYVVGQRDHLVERSDAYDAARDEANDLLTAYVDQEVGVRGYVITGDESFLDSYYQGQQDAERSRSALRRILPPTDPDLHASVDAVEAAAEQWHERSAEPEIQATAEGRDALAAAVVGSRVGRELFDELRGAITRLRDGIRAEDERTKRSLALARRQINIALAVAIAAGVVLLLVMSIALRRWSTQPLAAITLALRDVAAGDLERRIPSVGPRDVAALGADAELMRRRIVTELDSARRAEQALRGRGGVISALRDELSPTQQPLPTSITVAAAFEPVKGVLAGDWYDVLCLDDGCVAVCLIDVSGHGQATGVFALQAKNLMLAGLRQERDAGDVLGWMAASLGDTGDSFLTGFVAKIDPGDGSCRYASAGHLPALVTHDHRVEELGPTGPLLGPLPGEWSTRETQLSPGSVLVLYTDGVTEARGPADDDFGEERLRAVVAARAGEHPQAVVSTVVDAVHDHARGAAHDDLTLVATRWLPRPDPGGA
ncbi:MAG TPA: SpoIIE family protein phosphatase [Egibacteraceae bacterium]|nr:SpoIIE family protein phosphatase [Egibacteraceae bacterium]HVM14611.1 SpoIIE family protein phosphatase [Egibacteraceae bacterium]